MIKNGQVKILINQFDRFGNGVSFCPSKHEMRGSRILSTSNFASVGDFPSKSSAAKAQNRVPNVRIRN